LPPGAEQGEGRLIKLHRIKVSSWRETAWFSSTQTARKGTTKSADIFLITTRSRLIDLIFACESLDSGIDDDRPQGVGELRPAWRSKGVIELINNPCGK
jgi:hypothetical protein